MQSNQMLLFAVALVLSLAACGKEEAAVPVDDTDSAGSNHTYQSSGQSREQRMASGEKLYAAHCAACHQANGQGLTGAFPPLTESSYLAEGAGPAISVVLNGLKGPITVNGVRYNAIMPSLSYLNDGEVADVLTFVMNSWNNPGGEVSPEEVAAARQAK